MNRNIILLVEDNDDDVELTQRAFSKSNIANEMVVAKDGQEALDYLFGTGPMPQVVLLDLNLPRINGLEVLRRIRADGRTKHLPVVILTTSTEDTDIIGGYNLGANSYVRKPVDFGQFAVAAAQLGLYWLVLNVSPSTGSVAG